MAQGAIDIRMIGDKALGRALADLSPAVQKKIVRTGLRAGAKVILERARAIVRRKSGDLARLLKVRARKTRTREVFGAVVITPKKSELGIPETTPGGKPTGYYPAHLETGTSGMAAHPYLRPAADEAKEAAFKAIADSIGEGIDERWRRDAAVPGGGA